jgi:hypothetical protein
VPEVVVDTDFDTKAVLVVPLVVDSVGGVLFVVTLREEVGAAAALNSEPEPKAALAV